MIELPRRDALDSGLLLIYMIGIYTGYTPSLGGGLVLPAVIAGLAGFALLLRRTDEVEEGHVLALFTVIALYLVSIVIVPQREFLIERFKGFIQISYAFVCTYALFLTCVGYDRERLSRIFLAFTLFIVVGCLFENYTGLRAVSDLVRSKLYSYGLYESDIRDELLYGRIRPKLFTSEPSAVTFAFTLFSFCWFCLSTMRSKIVLYLLLVALSYFTLRGPTLMIGLALLGVFYLCFPMQGRRPGDELARNAVILGLAVVAGVMGALILYLAGRLLFADRLNDIANGEDPSFFFRVMGPALVAFAVMKKYPIWGAGLTGEDNVSTLIMSTYANARGFSIDWPIDDVRYIVTNYFWHHWIYLGVVGGLLMIGAITFYLIRLGAPRPVFAWFVWALMGQASGAYVSPKTWTVMMLAAAVGTMWSGQPVQQRSRERDIGLYPARAAK
jgi:hypothetical protein